MFKDKNKIDYSVYTVTDTDICPRGRLIATVSEAIRGGSGLIQLREKDITTREFYAEAMELKKICDAAGVPLLINDRIDIALAADADGVHLGQSDMPLIAARKLLGEDKIIGISAGNVEQAEEAVRGGADYLGSGAAFSTNTKKDANWIGAEGIKAIADYAHNNPYGRIPIVGIGGINLSNAAELSETGIDGVAVVSCIMGSDDPRGAAAELKKIVGGFRRR